MRPWSCNRGWQSSGWPNYVHYSTRSLLPAAGIYPTAKEPAMESGQGHQRDLFEEAPQAAELQPELRCKIALLLQVLLTEAADVQQHRAESAAHDGKEAGDDQDHA
jgi:hypothetical protein